MDVCATDVAQWQQGYANAHDPGNYFSVDCGAQQQLLDYGYSSDSASHNYSEYQECGQLSPATTVASSSSSPVPAFTYALDFDPGTVFSELPGATQSRNAATSPKNIPGKRQSSVTVKAVSAEVRAKRRLDANARERKRMTGLNGAFSRLRAVLGCTRDRPLSKMEALQMARQRIAELQEMLAAGK